MGDRLTYKDDEHDVDFSDTRGFAIQRWDDAVLSIKQSLSSADWETISQPRDWQVIYLYIRKRGNEQGVSAITKRTLNHIQPLPRSLNNLTSIFISGMVGVPYDADFDVLWGLLYLNIKLSCVSTDRLERTAEWMRKLRSVVELFNRCLDNCEDLNEARYAMVDVLEYLLQSLGESVKYLRNYPIDEDTPKGWKTLKAKIKENLGEMDNVVKHLNEITTYSKVNQDRQVKSLSLRHAPIVLPEEYCTFPINMIPRQRNVEFYGRVEELAKIDKYLTHRGNSNLRTYTIYGRRGVGKTDIALEYVYSNPSEFEAIFWIQCETSLSLRQSFTDAAVQLNLPSADRNGHHEENQLAVQKWLKTTKRKWLLIFDNAERESILRGFWPVGASGAILITSRKYYNFMNDAQRKGDTVKPFNENQSWDLLMKLLGPEWQDQDRRGLIKVSEEAAARKLLKSLGGLALAIQQAAQLIKDETTGKTIASTYESFKEHKKNLPPRASGDRSDIVHSLDSLWNMTFINLSRNARHLLSVLSLLSPDGILIDLFLPKNQQALDGKLQFCKQPSNLIDPKSQADLSSIIRAPAPLTTAIEELVRFRLIKQEGRELWAHRVVQEAMNYHSTKELQDYFDSASKIVYEAFPEQVHGDYLTKKQRSACLSYIPHGAHLSLQFATLHRADPENRIKGSDEFIKLLSNCAWYLYEVSDYDMCIRVVEAAWSACENKEDMQYATLCNIAGGSYYELNKLRECRKNWEKFLKIQSTILPEGDLERSNSLHNMGNLEAVSDSLDEAMDYFNRAIEIRIGAGDMAASLLANSYLCLSRVHFLQGRYEEAFKMVAESEALFFRTAGADAHFMAHVHYAFGNIEFAQKNWASAKRAYDQSLKIGLASAPIHPITAAAYYSLGCVEFERKNHDNAKAYLDKAMAIAQLRSPNRDDGTMARILWKTSEVLKDDTFGTYKVEADEMRIRAEVAQRELTNSGEGGLVFAMDDEGNADPIEVEDSYDALVPGYFR